MRQKILTLQVKVDREFGIMDIGKSVGFNPKTRLFQIATFPVPGWTVIAYNSPCLATVDFTPLNENRPPDKQIETVDDLYAYFDALTEYLEECEKSAKMEGVFVENTEDETVIDETTDEV